MFVSWLVMLAALPLLDCMQIGRGIADITGMASQGVLYGYGSPDLDARGIHLRQYTRAFAFQGDDGTDVAVVVSEICMFTQALVDDIIEMLQTQLPGVYSHENVMFLATHSHSTPGGMHTYAMYSFPSGGRTEPTVLAYTRGTVKAMVTAYNDLKEGKILTHQGDLTDASINRSPYSYDQNPIEEQQEYEYNVDVTMTVMKLVDEDDDEMGMLNFFPVHTTSMKNYNHLISTDNKGYASLKFEQYMNPDMLTPSEASVLGAFAQSAEGDSSPNIDGERCEGTDEYCYYNTSTCPEDVQNPQLCTGRGPAGEMFKDTAIIGQRQFDKALELYLSAEDQMTSDIIDFRHQWVNMSSYYLYDDEDGNPVTTCPPAMGYSFAAGASDGPGIPPFFQGDTEGTEVDGPLGGLIDNLLNVSDEIAACHAPKPILLPTGVMDDPHDWQPDIISVQLFRIGDIVLIGIPVEITTMCGRRLHDTVKHVMEELGGPREDNLIVIPASLANGFTSYVTTFEEYQVQRYEGASTTYGPRLLEAYQMIFEDMATKMMNNEELVSGPPPPDYRAQMNSSLDDPTNDLAPDGMAIGDLLFDAADEYEQNQTVEVVFVSGDPGHYQFTDDTFLEVQQQDADEWVIVFTDAHWETIFWWDSDCLDLGPDIGPGSSHNCDEEQNSNATIQWDIPADQTPGVYRILHRGYYQQEPGVILPYENVSREFTVVPMSRREDDYWSYRYKRPQSDSKPNNRFIYAE